MENRSFIFGVDLDGVCADFYEGLRPIAAEWLGVALDSLSENVSYGLPEWDLNRCGSYENLHRFAVTERNLFEILRPIYGAPAALRRIAHQHKIRIRIITHRLFISHFHETAISQTVRWLDHHDIPYWDLCFMRDKAAVGADLYVEDSPSNVRALRKDCHETIVFSNSTNRGVEPPRADNWDEVEKLLADAVERWKRSSDRDTIAL